MGSEVYDSALSDAEVPIAASASPKNRAEVLFVALVCFLIVTLLDRFAGELARPVDVLQA